MICSRRIQYASKGPSLPSIPLPKGATYQGGMHMHLKRVVAHANAQPQKQPVKRLHSHSMSMSTAGHIVA